MGQSDERITITGGGNGVKWVALGLRPYRTRINLVHTAADSGGSAGETRELYGTISPGDLRRGFEGLADPQSAYAKILTEVKPDGSKPANEILAKSFLSLDGSTLRGLDLFAAQCGCKGRVLPVSETVTHLHAKLTDGTILDREHLIDTRQADDRHIIEFWLDPPAQIQTRSAVAMMEADKLIIAPGSPITSIGVNTRVQGFNHAARYGNKNKKIICVMNLLATPAESRDLTASQIASTLLRFLEFGKRKFDYIVCHKWDGSTPSAKDFPAHHQIPVVHDIELKQFAKKIIYTDVACEEGGVIHHDPVKLGPILADL